MTGVTSEHTNYGRQNLDLISWSSTGCGALHDVLLSGGLKLADPGVTTVPRGLTEATSRLAAIFTTAAVPGRGVVLDVRDVRSISHCSSSAQGRSASRLVKETRNNECNFIVHGALVWTADGRQWLRQQGCTTTPFSCFCKRMMILSAKCLKPFQSWVKKLRSCSGLTGALCVGRN